MIKYPKYEKILFCTDFSENSDYAFDYACGIAKRDEGLLYILHVIPENPYQGFVQSYVSSDRIKELEKGIEEGIAGKFKEHYVKKIEGGISLKWLRNLAGKKMKYSNLQGRRG